MSFLDEYGAVPATDPATQVKVIYKWLRGDWRAMFAELREKRPVFVAPPFTMLTRFGDVLNVLSQHQVFSVRAYAMKMDPSVGTFMLGRDETEHNWHDKSLMKSLLRYDDLTGIRALVASVAAESLAVGGEKVELVSRLGRLVPLRVVQQYFGFPGPDDATMLRWSKATQSDMFRNPSNDPTVNAANIQAGTEMRAYVHKLLPDRTASGPADDVVTRLARMAVAGMSGLGTERLVANVCGLLVGAIETTSQAIVQAIEQILLRDDVKGTAIAAAQAGDTATFDSIVWEALRFNPITGLVARFCERDAVLAPGTVQAAPIGKGQVVVACIGSAMFDPVAFPEPELFRQDRPFGSYLHFGFGHHECLGKYVGAVMVPEAVRQALLLPGLQLQPGSAGKIDFTGSAFPERFEVLRAG